MIQRIQTIWLLLAAVFALLTFKLPFYIGTDQTGVVSFQLTATANVLLSIVTAFVATVAFLTIFFFNKRMLQIRLSALGILLELLVLFLYYHEVKTLTSGSLTLWSVFSFAILLFFFLAIKRISKDEKLIKESDRLR
ncbi:MAG: DUF4293 family protein [Ferruginibacter sp.]